MTRIVSYDNPFRDVQPPRREAVQRELDELFRLEDEEASEVILVRHAEPAGRYSSPMIAEDPLLSCQGLVQAERLAERLRSLWIDTFYTAPERRCLQTAVVLAELSDRPVQTIDGLREIEFDPQSALMEACGVSYSGRFAEDPRWDALPGFGPGGDFRKRAIQAIEAVLAGTPGRRSVIVTHNSVINAFVGMLLEVPRDILFAADHASVCVVRARGELHAVRSLNDTSHLCGLVA